MQTFLCQGDLIGVAELVNACLQETQVTHLISLVWLDEM